MEFQPRDEFLNDRLSALLDRRSPPQSIKANQAAQLDEIAGLVRAVIRLAPTRDYADWWGRFEDELLSRAKTRAWPTLNEMAAAAQAIRGNPGFSGDIDQDGIERAAVDRMESWFNKFNSQLPGHGKPSRTADLIRRGVLANEAEARFYGFDLTDDQRRRAHDQPACDAERRHHDRVMDDLMATRQRMEAHAAEFAAAKRNVKPNAA